MSRLGEVAVIAAGRRRGPELTLGGLLVLAGQGDRGSFEQLYDATSTRIHSLVLRQLGRDRAERATADIYAMLWRRAGSYAPGHGHPLAWIISMVGHVLAEDRSQEPGPGGWSPFRSRRAALAPRCTAGVATAPGAPGGAGGSGLTRQQQDTLTLVHLGGYSHREVSELLRLDLDDVRAALRGGLRLLRTELPAAS